MQPQNSKLLTHRHTHTHKTSITNSTPRQVLSETTFGIMQFKAEKTLSLYSRSGLQILTDLKKQETKVKRKGPRRADILY